MRNNRLVEVRRELSNSDGLVLKTDVGKSRVSTVRLPDVVFHVHQLELGGGWETCLFLEGGSEVVERYKTEEDARAGHAKWVAHCEKEPVRSSW